MEIAFTVRCKACHYSLENLTASPEGGHRCPECGRAFDPGKPTTFESDLPQESEAIPRTVAVFGVVAFLFIFVFNLQEHGYNNFNDWVTSGLVAFAFGGALTLAFAVMYEITVACSRWHSRRNNS